MAVPITKKAWIRIENCRSLRPEKISREIAGGPLGQLLSRVSDSTPSAKVMTKPLSQADCGGGDVRQLRASKVESCSKDCGWKLFERFVGRLVGVKDSSTETTSTESLDVAGKKLSAVFRSNGVVPALRG